MGRIVIVANFTSGENEKNRFIHLAKLLSDKGHEVEVLTTDFRHGKKIPKGINKDSSSFKIVHIHEPGYKTNISLRRLYSHRKWGKNVFNYIKTKINRPDLIYCAIPSLTAPKLLGKYCQKKNINFITDIQDLWPEGFEQLIKNKILKKLLLPVYKYADKAYQYSDIVIGVSQTYVNRGIKSLKISGKEGKNNKTNNNGLTVYIGNNLKVFDEAKKNKYLIKRNEDFWIGYIGTLSFSYDIKCVFDALNILKNKYNIKNIKFIIMGEGPLKEEFQSYGSRKNIDNMFTGPLPYEEMVSNLCQCDIVVNPIVKGAAQSITNKIGDYAFAGLPVINTQPNQEYRDLLEEYDCGINCGIGNSNEMADAIYKLYINKNLRKQMGLNGRKLGEEKFDRNKTYSLIVNTIESLINK